jgi:plastocyanin
VTRRAAAIAVLSATATLAASAPAAADQRISASPRDQYANPTITIDQGERVTFFNGDVLDEHSVTATTAGSDGRPLFDSGVIQPGAELPVVGVQSLTAGTYEFFCTVHHFMRGTITVTGTGTPVPRPPDTTPARPTVAITTASLSRVRRSGRLPVRAGADEAATLHLTATMRAGRHTLTLARGTLKLAGPGGQAVRLALTAAGRRALRNRTSAVVTVRAAATDTAGNRSTATGRRTLRR